MLKHAALAWWWHISIAPQAAAATYANSQASVPWHSQQSQSLRTKVYAATVSINDVGTCRKSGWLIAGVCRGQQPCA